MSKCFQAIVLFCFFLVFSLLVLFCSISLEVLLCFVRFVRLRKRKGTNFRKGLVFTSFPGLPSAPSILLGESPEKEVSFASIKAKANRYVCVYCVHPRARFVTPFLSRSIKTITSQVVQERLFFTASFRAFQSQWAKFSFGSQIN